MISKPIHQLKLSDLQALIGNAPESKTLEFKREMPAGTSEEKLKLLKAVSALANTAGGDLLIGVDAPQGVPTAIPGIQLANLDAEKLRLEQILASQLEPRLPRIDIEAIDCGNGRHVLAIRVARSWIAPHRVLLNDKFYGRNSGGSYELDVSELRSAFVLSETTAERIRKFRNDRLMKIAAGETPLAMHPGAAMIIHVVPFSTFAAGRTLDIVQAIGAGYVMALPPGRLGHPNNYAVNLDGLITYSNPPDEPAHGYAQVFRSGAVEGVDLLGTDDKQGTPYLVGANFENTVVSAVKNYLTFVKSHDLGYPVFVFLSFCGMKGCQLRTRTEFGSGFYVSRALGQDIIALPEVTSESDVADVPSVLRSIFNTVWNAFGFAKSDKYDQQGKWIGSA
jgi:hypothetical protein